MQAELSAVQAATGGAFAAFSFPNSPNVTNEVEVTNLSQLLSNINVSGRRTVIPAGVTINLNSTLRISADDVELVVLGTLTSGSGSVGMAVFGNSRTRIICAGNGLIETFITIENFATDITFWGLNLNAENQNGGADNNWYEPVRFLVAHSLISTNSYAGFIHNGNSDIFIANSQFRGGATSRSQFRTSEEQRAIYLDNRFAIRDGYSGGWAFRKHDEPDNLYVARNQFEGGGTWITMNGAGTSEPSKSGNNFWYLDNAIYPRSGEGSVDAEFVFADLSHAPGPDSINNLTIINNDIYTGNGSAIYPSGGYPADWTASGNDSLPVRNPPTWSRQPYSTYPPDYADL